MTRLVYNKERQNLTFTLYPVNSTGAGNPTLGSSKLFLWKVNNILDADSVYDISGQPELIKNTSLFTLSYNSADKNVIYSSIAPMDPGYYVLYIILTTTGGKEHFARITFTSDQYVCPFSPSFPDFYQNFQPCISNSTETTQSPGFPCLNFQNSSLTCINCFYGYELVNGSCVYSDTCPDRFYFHFGICYPVSNACLTYDPFTGDCRTCVNNGSNILNGACILPTVVCGFRQVVINNTCVDVSLTCLDFDNITGLCITCINGFDIQSNGSCTPTVINCLSTQYTHNGVCVDIPR
jgi:hypothetical protein